jgi:hypothetical protein
MVTVKKKERHKNKQNNFTGWKEQFRGNKTCTWVKMYAEKYKKTPPPLCLSMGH